MKYFCLKYVKTFVWKNYQLKRQIPLWIIQPYVSCTVHCAQYVLQSLLFIFPLFPPNAWRTNIALAFFRIKTVDNVFQINCYLINISWHLFFGFKWGSNLSNHPYFWDRSLSQHVYLYVCKNKLKLLIPRALHKYVKLYFLVKSWSYITNNLKNG